MQTNHLFVYGSLLSGFKGHAYEYIKRYFIYVGQAVVKGTMYDLGNHPVVTSQDTGHLIKGELYEVQNPAQFPFVIAQIDDYEGLHPEEGEETFYEREVVTAYLNGVEYNAWVYWYNRPVFDKPIVESGDMLEYLRKNKQG